MVSSRDGVETENEMSNVLIKHSSVQTVLSVLSLSKQ